MNTTDNTYKQPVRTFTEKDMAEILTERDSYWKRIFLDLIKAVPLDESVIESEESRKWFRFGAYDFGAKLSDKIKEL